MYKARSQSLSGGLGSVKIRIGRAPFRASEKIVKKRIKRISGPYDILDVPGGRDSQAKQAEDQGVSDPSLFDKRFYFFMVIAGEKFNDSAQEASEQNHGKHGIFRSQRRPAENPGQDQDSCSPFFKVKINHKDEPQKISGHASVCKRPARGQGNGGNRSERGRGNHRNPVNRGELSPVSPPARRQMQNKGIYQPYAQKKEDQVKEFGEQVARNQHPEKKQHLDEKWKIGECGKGDVMDPVLLDIFLWPGQVVTETVALNGRSHSIRKNDDKKDRDQYENNDRTDRWFRKAEQLESVGPVSVKKIDAGGDKEHDKQNAEDYGIKQPRDSEEKRQHPDNEKPQKAGEGSEQGRLEIKPVHLLEDEASDKVSGEECGEPGGDMRDQVKNVNPPVGKPSKKSLEEAEKPERVKIIVYGKPEDHPCNRNGD